MDITLTELFHLLFPSESTEHDGAHSFALRHIHGWSTFDAVAVSDSLAKRITEVQTAANVELMVVQRIDKFNFVFTRRSWNESPYRILLLRQRSDALRAAALAAEESARASDAWRIQVHEYMGKLAIRIADKANITKVGFLKTALQDMAARLKYDLDRIRAELGSVFGYDDAEIAELFVAPPVKKDKPNEQDEHREGTGEAAPDTQPSEDPARTLASSNGEGVESRSSTGETATQGEHCVFDYANIGGSNHRSGIQDPACDTAGTEGGDGGYTGEAEVMTTPDDGEEQLR